MSKKDTEITSQTEGMKLFEQIFLVFFSDYGPTIIDYYSTFELMDDLDVLAGLIQARTMGAVKDETEVFGKLSGPDAFPSGGRAVWFSWFIENRFSSDQRILEHGAQITLFCVYDPKHDQIINKSREVIEEIIQQISSRLTKIEEIILRIKQLDDSAITEDQYKQILTTKGSGKLTRQIDTLLSENILRHWKEVVSHEAFEKLPIPQKLQTIVNEEGSYDPAIMYLVIANHKGFPIAYYSQEYQATSRWISTATIIKMDGIRRIAHALVLDNKLYDQQATEEEMNDSFTNLMKGKSGTEENPGLILIETAQAYVGMGQITIEGASGESFLYYLFTRCKKTMQQGMLQMVMERTIARIRSEVHTKNAATFREVKI